jgi:hypothetical protein
MQLVVCGAAIASHSHYSHPLKDEEKKKTCHLGCGSLHVPPPPFFLFSFLLFLLSFQRILLPPFDTSFWVAHRSEGFSPLL